MGALTVTLGVLDHAAILISIISLTELLMLGRLSSIMHLLFLTPSHISIWGWETSSVHVGEHLHAWVSKTCSI